MRTFDAIAGVTNVSCDSCGAFVFLTGDQSKNPSTVVSPGWYRCEKVAGTVTDACCDVEAYKQGGPRPGSVVEAKQLVTLG